MSKDQTATATTDATDTTTATADVAATATTSGGQGRAVSLPNGQLRADYIRDEFYGKGTTRSVITKSINEMLEAAGRGEEKIPYQIVFAATKEKTDPRVTAAANKAEKAAAKAAQKVIDDAAAAEAAKNAPAPTADTSASASDTDGAPAAGGKKK